MNGLPDRLVLEEALFIFIYLIVFLLFGIFLFETLRAESEFFRASRQLFCQCFIMIHSSDYYYFVSFVYALCIESTLSLCACRSLLRSSVAIYPKFAEMPAIYIGRARGY